MTAESKKQKARTKKKKTSTSSKKKTITVRQIDGLQIVFYDTETTYVCHKNGINLYHTWFLPKDGVYYSHVRYFRRALMELKEQSLTITHINHLAYRHGLVISAVEKLPDLTGKIVKIVDRKPEGNK